MERQVEKRVEEFKRKAAGFWKKDTLLLMILAGILLFIIALPVREKETGDLSAAQGLLQEEGRMSENAADRDFTGPVQASLEEYMTVSSDGGTANWQDLYGEKIQKQLEEILGSMDGVGNVKTMITFSSSQEYVLEKESDINRSNTVEKDSQGGNRTITQYQSADTTVYSNVSGETIPYVVKTLPPKVEGVLVVAQGAGSGAVSRNVTEVVQALFSIEAHKVRVVPMKSD